MLLTAVTAETPFKVNKLKQHGIFGRRSNFNKSVACQQSWPESGRLPYWGKLQERVYRNWSRDVDQLKSLLIEEWEQLQQSVINEAVKQWCQRLRACIQARGGHFEVRTQTLGRPTVSYFFSDTV